MVVFKKIAIGQGDDYTTGCLLDYNYFKNYYKMIAIDLSKPQALEADPKAIQYINFIGKLERDGNRNTTMFLLLKKLKKPLQIFQRNCKSVISFFFALI